MTLTSPQNGPFRKDPMPAFDPSTLASEDLLRHLQALQAESRELRHKEAFLNRLLVAMTLLVRARSLSQGDLDAALQDITRMSSRTLEVQRCGIWLFDAERTRIRCACLFDAKTNGFQRGMELHAVQYPDYFSEIERGRIVAVEDAVSDPRTRAFSHSYLEPVGITSMIDVPIKRGDRLEGVLCHEHTGPLRTWQPEEQQFAAFVSSLVSLGWDVSERVQAAGA